MNTHDDVLKINFEPLIFRILGGRYLLVEPLITHENSKLSKISSFYYFAMIFFSSESWDAILFKNWKGGPKGGPPEDLYWFEIWKFSWKFQHQIALSNKNRAPGGPPFGPPFQFLKSIASQLSLEKNYCKIIKTRNFR